MPRQAKNLAGLFFFRESAFFPIAFLFVADKPRNDRPDAYPPFI